jgi:tRNA threonylcarbamoyladenosine biosynthesis protein TsaE
MVYYTESAEQTSALGEQFALTLKKGAVVLLKGEMGAGKTVFVKGVAKALGITERITSPTYAYMNDYDGVLYHYDCYRLSSGEDAEGLGLTDYFYADGICIIEWSENIADVLPKNCIEVKIEKIGESQRRIEF